MASYKSLIPWVKRPLVTVPPMAYTSRSDLTIAAAHAGYEPETFITDLSLVLTALQTLDLPDLPSRVFPFGVGFIVWTTPIEILDQVFTRDGVTPHPAAVWLFAGQFEDWIPVIRERSPETLIYVQVGELNVQPESHEPNSKEARRAVNAGVDVLVAQGSDCGGHGAANSASIISLVPEIVSAFPQIPVLAAGGIVDASGILAALVLGAEGVVMGTRFATTPESAMADTAKALILRTTDGGATTKRTRIYDVLRGKGNWLTTHNGRAIVNETLREHENGVKEKELQGKYDIALKENDYNRLVVYAGTGLGLVMKQQSVAEILDDIEMQLTEKIRSVNERLLRP